MAQRAEYLAENMATGNLSLGQNLAIKDEFPTLDHLEEDVNYNHSQNLILQKIDSAESLEDLINTINSTKREDGHLIGRHFQINLLALASYGTIEIRRHDGCVDARQIAQWVILLDHIMDSAIEAVIAKTKMYNDCKINELDKKEMATRIESSYAAEIGRYSREFVKSTLDIRKSTPETIVATPNSISFKDSVIKRSQ